MTIVGLLGNSGWRAALAGALSVPADPETPSFTIEDLVRHPYSKDSVYNFARGSDAVLADCPLIASHPGGVQINHSPLNYAHPVALGRSTDPLVTIVRAGSTTVSDLPAVNVRLPANWPAYNFAGAGWEACTLVQEDGTTWNFYHLDHRNLTAQLGWRDSIYGVGHSTETGVRVGTSASLANAFCGAFPAEIVETRGLDPATAIPFALHMAVPRSSARNHVAPYLLNRQAMLPATGTDGPAYTENAASNPYRYGEAFTFAMAFDYDAQLAALEAAATTLGFPDATDAIEAASYVLGSIYGHCLYFIDGAAIMGFRATRSMDPTFVSRIKALLTAVMLPNLKQITNSNTLAYPETAITTTGAGAYTGSPGVVSDPVGGGDPVAANSAYDSSGDPVLTPGVNLLTNSRLAGAGSGSADDWGARFPGEATPIFSDSPLPGHRRARFQAGAEPERCAIEQIYRVTSGLRYQVSALVSALDAATDPSSVVLNHVPFSLGGVVGGPAARPTLGSIAAGGKVGKRVSYAFDATANGEIRIVAGLDGAGDVTLEQLALQQSDTLLAYAATDPAPAAPPAAGIGLGNPIKAEGLMPRALKYNNYTVALAFRVPRDGTIDRLGFEAASNNPDDINPDGTAIARTKSMGTGSYTLPLKLSRAMPAIGGDSLDRMLSLPAGVSLQDVMYRPDFAQVLRVGSVVHQRGDNLGSGDRRRWHVWTLPTPLTVAAGDLLCLVGYAKASGASGDYISFTNPPSMGPSTSIRMVGPWGLSPDRSYSPREGAEAFGMVLRESSPYTATEAGKRYMRGPENGQIGLYYTDGYSYGQPSREDNGLTNQLQIGGSNRARERFRNLGVTFACRYVWLPCYWLNSGSIPTSDLTLQLVDETTSTTWTASAAPASSGTTTVATVRGYDGGVHTSTSFPDFVRFDLEAPRSIASGHDFRVEVMSADAARRYRLFGFRHAVTAHDVIDPPGAPITGLTARPGQSDAALLSYVERSSDGGSSWSRLTLYSGNRTDLSLSFWLEPA